MILRIMVPNSYAYIYIHIGTYSIYMYIAPYYNLRSIPYLRALGSSGNQGDNFAQVVCWGSAYGGGDASEVQEELEQERCGDWGAA